MRSKMAQIEKEDGRPIKEIIIEDFNEVGTQTALAEKYGVTQSTITYWLMKLGLQVKTILVDAQEG